ncbi:MAG: MarC family protein [Bacteroidetes bacterium]|nr:MarC family protein [Bacteroidota bacterium]MBS1739999.1 MarC family protein [Bacteroidota bacterium]MBS1777645.1 MarC family protein [Bacteroidota bacterium]
MFGFEKIKIGDIVTLTFTLFAVIDVLGSIPVIISLKKKMGDISATQATLVSGALMLLFFFVGEQMLNFMGLDIHSFAIAGSIVIFILGLEMVLGIEFFRSEKDIRSGAVVPIAFPIIAGSGTLTTIMSLKAEYNALSILIAILINLVVVFITLRSINLVERMLGPSGISVVRKFFGVILLAIAVKIFKNNMAM